MSNLYITFSEDFEERYEKYLESLNSSELSNSTKMETRALLTYNSTTGVGEYNGNKFKFSDGSSEYKVFRLLYENIGKKISRLEILIQCGFYEEGDKVNEARRPIETEAINELTKKLRKKTGLDIDTLVINNGNLILDLKNIKSTPDNTQNEPK